MPSWVRYNTWESDSPVLSGTTNLILTMKPGHPLKAGVIPNSVTHLKIIDDSPSSWAVGSARSVIEAGGIPAVEELTFGSSPRKFTAVINAGVIAEGVYKITFSGGFSGQIKPGAIPASAKVIHLELTTYEPEDGRNGLRSLNLPNTVRHLRGVSFQNFSIKKNDRDYLDILDTLSLKDPHDDFGAGVRLFAGPNIGKQVLRSFPTVYGLGPFNDGIDTDSKEATEEADEKTDDSDEPEPLVLKKYVYRGQASVDIPSDVNHLTIDHPEIMSGGIPNHIVYLTFTMTFTAALNPGDIPNSVRFLNISMYNSPIPNGVIPEGVLEFYFAPGYSYDWDADPHPIKAGGLPKSLTLFRFFAPTRSTDNMFPTGTIPNSVRTLILNYIHLSGFVIPKGVVVCRMFGHPSSPTVPNTVKILELPEHINFTTDYVTEELLYLKTKNMELYSPALRTKALAEVARQAALTASRVAPATPTTGLATPATGFATPATPVPGLATPATGPAFGSEMVRDAEGRFVSPVRSVPGSPDRVVMGTPDFAATGSPFVTPTGLRHPRVPSILSGTRRSGTRTTPAIRSGDAHRSILFGRRLFPTSDGTGVSTGSPQGSGIGFMDISPGVSHPSLGLGQSFGSDLGLDRSGFIGSRRVVDLDFNIELEPFIEYILDFSIDIQLFKMVGTAGQDVGGVTRMFANKVKRWLTDDDNKLLRVTEMGLYIIHPMASKKRAKFIGKWIGVCMQHPHIGVSGLLLDPVFLNILKSPYIGYGLPVDMLQLINIYSEYGICSTKLLQSDGMEPLRQWHQVTIDLPEAEKNQSKVENEKYPAFQQLRINAENEVLSALDANGNDYNHEQVKASHHIYLQLRHYLLKLQLESIGAYPSEEFSGPADFPTIVYDENTEFVLPPSRTPDVARRVSELLDKSKFTAESDNIDLINRLEQIRDRREEMPSILNETIIPVRHATNMCRCDRNFEYIQKHDSLLLFTTVVGNIFPLFHLYQACYTGFHDTKPPIQFGIKLREFSELVTGVPISTFEEFRDNVTLVVKLGKETVRVSGPDPVTTEEREIQFVRQPAPANDAGPDDPAPEPVVVPPEQVAEMILAKIGEHAATHPGYIQTLVTEMTGMSVVPRGTVLNFVSSRSNQSRINPDTQEPVLVYDPSPQYHTCFDQMDIPYKLNDVLERTLKPSTIMVGASDEAEDEVTQAGGRGMIGSRRLFELLMFAEF